MHPAAHIGLTIARSRRGRQLLLALFGGLLLGFALVVAFMVSAVGAVASVCGREGAADPAGSPAYVSQQPSEEALADIPADYLQEYRAAAEEENVDWAVLAAVGKIESDHGRLQPGCETSYAGARGPMQFMPSTWAAAGLDGDGDGTADVCDYRDAIPSAARYLADGGAPQDYEAALFQYNHAGWYVQDVLAQAEEYRAAAERQGGEVASSGTAPAPASFLPPIGARPAYAAGEDATVGDPRETDYSASELETLRLINGYREESGLGPLLLSDELSIPAARYAHDMAKYDAYSVPAPHVTGPSDWYSEGADLTVRMNAEGYFADRYGENIAAGQATAGEVFEAWRASPEHDRMMLNPEMKAVGIGLVENPGTSYEEFWVTDFGSEADPTARPVRGAIDDGDAGAGSSGAEGNAEAVFPLPKEYLDSYEDTWGAARSHGGHEGTDLFAPDGTPIYSTVSGTVVPVSGADGRGWNTLGGWTVMIEAAEDVGPIRAGDTLYYAHMLEPTPLRPGDEVEAGDVVGRVGSTGEGPPGSLLQPASRGRHLHLGWYDPSGARAEAPSGAMNPYPLLEWLRENGGTASGASPLALAPLGSLPYCVAFRTVGFVSDVGEGLSGLLGGEAGGALETGSAAELMRADNFDASPQAVEDLRAGVVDERLISVLLRITERRRIYVSVFKTGHPYGEYLPSELGGGPNSHYYGLTADISAVDGKPVESNGTDPGVLEIGEILLGIHPSERPDEVIGPPDWTAELGVSREDGFITDPGYTETHRDHLHVGYTP